MTNVLPDLRLTIAGILDNLVLHHPARNWRQVRHGAETLRWCAQYEGDRETPDLVAEIQRLEGILNEIDQLDEPKAADYRAGVASALESW